MSNNAGGGENEDEADVPMAQRRRFTRVEMARVLMERNQYKVTVFVKTEIYVKSTTNDIIVHILLSVISHRLNRPLW